MALLLLHVGAVLCGIWYDLIGYILGLGTLKIFPYKRIVTAFSLYVTPLITLTKGFIGTL